MSSSESFQHFQVLRKPDSSLWELGRGAMGVTYKAFDTNLRSHVALKVINAQHLDSDTARQRFLREARAAAGMSHPNIARVFHLGESGGDYFYAMEFIDGETVESLVHRRGPLPAAVALKITLQVARALRAAERAGLVHRDIKPANLMLVREEDGEPDAFDEEGVEPQVKVIDFGLAKAVEKDAATATITVAGFVGTPHFASPEQLEERKLDVRSDIYSLGVTLWYMLAGRPPFAGTVPRIMSQHLGVKPPFEQLANQSPAVVALLARMLEKDRARRPQTATDLRREIEQTLRAIGRPADADVAATSVPPAPPPATVPTPPSPVVIAKPPAAMRPISARKGIPLGLFTLIVAVTSALAGGLGYFAYRHYLRSMLLDKPVRRAEPVAMASPSPQSAPTPTPVSVAPAAPMPAETEPPAPPEPPPTPTPAPTPNQEARYREILSDVKQTESAGRSVEAVDGYARLIADYPDHARQDTARLDALVNGLRTTAPPAGDTTALLRPMERAADAGSTAAMLYLGERLLDTDPGVAVTWYRKAADLGQVEAMVVLGDLSFRGVGVRRDVLGAVRWYQLASDKGSARAKVYLAEFYETGQGGLPRDLDQMFALLKEADATEPGNPATAEKLALAYEHGWGTSTDPKLAFECMKKAADGGVPNALGNLGSYYMRGFGTRPDPKAAAALFKQGADKKNAACQFFTRNASNRASAAPWSTGPPRRSFTANPPGRVTRPRNNGARCTRSALWRSVEVPPRHRLIFWLVKRLDGR